MTTLTARVLAGRPDRETILWGALLVNVEVLFVAVYFLASTATIIDPLTLVYPFVWINVSIWAVTSIAPSARSGPRRWLALAVGAAYFAVLAAAGGLLSPGHLLHGHAHATGLRIAWDLPPGWGPALLYAGDYVNVSLVPFKVIGYLALTYLVYVTLTDTFGAALPGLVGLFSCVSCTWPIIGTVLGAIFGGSSAIASAALSQSYGLSTAVFLSAVALLAYRPIIAGRRSPDRQSSD